MLAHRAYRFRNFVFVRQDSELFRQAVMRCSSKTLQQSFAAGGRSFGKDGIEVRKHVQRKAALQKPAQRNLTCPFKQPVRGELQSRLRGKGCLCEVKFQASGLNAPGKFARNVGRRFGFN